MNHVTIITKTTTWQTCDRPTEVRKEIDEWSAKNSDDVGTNALQGCLGREE